MQVSSSGLLGSENTNAEVSSGWRRKRRGHAAKRRAPVTVELRALSTSALLTVFRTPGSLTPSINPHCTWLFATGKAGRTGEGRRQSFTDSSTLYTFVYSFEGNNTGTWVSKSKPAFKVQRKIVATFLKKTYECGPRGIGPYWLRGNGCRGSCLPRGACNSRTGHRHGGSSP